MGRLLATVLLFGLGTGIAAAADCVSTGKDCQVELGSYEIAMPETRNGPGPVPALIFYHGAGGTGERVLKNTGMVSRFTERGYAVIAPNGMERPDSRFGPGWFFHPERPSLRDDLAFTKQVLADAQSRFDVDLSRILMSGFSIGGSLVWYMACRDPDIATAYAPVAGAFWRPHPSSSDCNGPVKMLHTHGWRDVTVPLEGRPLRDFTLFQGDVFYGMDVLRQVNGCKNLRADEFDTDGNFWRRWWTRCSEGSALQFNLHTGGHSVPGGWAEEAIAWFEQL